MKLEKIIMDNFRQYNGKNTIEFAKDDRNITLILGENNAGKTGIYRALLFALYGDRRLAQDSSSRNVHLVNFKSLKTNKPVKAVVTVVFSNNKGKYTVTRSVKAVNINDKYEENDEDELRLDFKDLEGETYKNYITEKDGIQDLINSILDDNIKEFFLFDGEKIETLARADADSRKEVKKGIIKLMEIDKLDKTREIINKLKRKEKNRITQISKNDDLEKIEKKRENCESEIEAAISQIDEYKENLTNTNEEINILQNKLSENEEVKNLINEKEKMEIELKGINQEIATSRDTLKNYHFKNGASLIINDYFIKISNFLNDEILKQDDTIPIHVVEETLNNGICLCCNQEVKNNPDSLAFLENIRDNYKFSKKSNLMQIINRKAKENINNRKDEITEIEKLLRKINEREDDLDKIAYNIDQIKERISGENQDEKNLKHMQKRYSKLLGTKDNDKRRIGELEDEISKLQKEVKGLDIKYNKLSKEDETLKYEIKRLKILENLDNKLSKIYNKYIERTRKKLGEETTKTFKELIDYEDMSLVNEIFISDKYEIDINDISGRNVTQDISQGQQMIVSLSFITSLARIASKSHGKVEYPLFMDTPFSRLSKVNRKNLIYNLPELTMQWIPLLTDTEYTDVEKEIFENTGKVGKTYKIKKIDKERSEIIEI